MIKFAATISSSCDENYRKNHYLWPYMKDCSFITSFPRLTSLCLLRTLAMATLSFEDAQNIVRVCKNLKRLVLDCDFYGRAIRYIISSLSGSLEVLWLQGRNYNDSMCQELSKCSRLRELGLIHVENITPFGLKFLGSLAKLEKLLLFYANNIDPNVFRYLVSSVTRFGEISPLWQNLKPTLANILETEEILITLNGQMLKNNLAI